MSTHGQQAPVGGLATPGRPGGTTRIPVGPVDTARYRSTIVKLGGGARDGLLYEPKLPGPNARVAVLYSDRNFGFDPPAAELAGRGYPVLYVSYPPLRPGEIGLPLDGFLETSRGIAYLRALPGVKSVVIEGWGAGATSMTLYADLAAHGATACQDKEVISPCKTDQADGLAKPDGLILLDPGLGAGSKVGNIDPAYEGSKRNRPDLDRFAAANGYDSKTGTATYSAEFRKRYFAAQSAKNNQVLDDALARLKVLDQGKGNLPVDEQLFVPGAVNVAASASLHNSDLGIMSHSKLPHTLLKADGSKAAVIVRSIRPATGPVGDDAIKKTLAMNDQPRGPYTLREFLANDAIRTRKDFALTEDDVVGIDWKSSNFSTPSQAEGVTIPTVVMANTCFQFVVASEITYDHLASKDKTLAGVEGSEHEFTPCGPQYGDTKQRLFDFVDGWLAKPGRF